MNSPKPVHRILFVCTETSAGKVVLPGKWLNS